MGATAKPRAQTLRSWLLYSPLLLLAAWFAFPHVRPTDASSFSVQWQPGELQTWASSSDGKAKLCIMQSSNYDIGEDALADASMYAWSMYARRHGYRYVRVMDKRPVDPKYKYGEKLCRLRWRKVAAMRHVLPQCELLMLADLDAAIADPSMPLTSLLDRWNFTEKHMVAQALDPGFAFQDFYPLPGGGTIHAANTGIMFWRNRPRGREILEQYWNAPDSNPPIPVLQKFPCDQGVWNKLVRPTLAPGELLLIPCNDANGFPGAALRGIPANCSGRFLRHFWAHHKPKAEALYRETVANLTRQMLLEEMLASGGFQRLDRPGSGAGQH